MLSCAVSFTEWSETLYVKIMKILKRGIVETTMLVALVSVLILGVMSFVLLKHSAAVNIDVSEKETCKGSVEQYVKMPRPGVDLASTGTIQCPTRSVKIDPSDKEQAKKVCDFIGGRMSAPSFLEEFANTASAGFDPKQDLERVGCANQTTMLSSESLEIAEMIQAAMRERYGAEELLKHFRHFDTICSATQDRQDAVLKLARSGIQVMIVVGGYNSSNTGHLCEISKEFCPAFHVRDAGEIISKDEIRHKPAAKPDVVVTRNWLPAGRARIGITAGASTPNRVIEEVILKIISCSDPQLAKGF